MKKYALIMLSLSTALHATTPNFRCGYKDYFRFSDNTHPTIHIISYNYTPEIYLQVISPRSFELRDSGTCHAGYGQITIEDNYYNWCILDIKDGPYMNHPEVKATCNEHGMQYLGMDYDGIGSYSYTIHID